MELVSVTKVIQHLEDGYGSSSALNDISASLLKKASKEVCQYVAKTNRSFRLVEDLLGAFQNLLKHNGSLFQFLVELGLLDLLADIFQSVYLRLQSHGIGDDLQTVVEILLESANVLGDLGSSAKSQACQSLCSHMLDLLQCENLDFQVKMEVVKSTNMLLDQCPTGTKESMINTETFHIKIKEIVSFIRNIGDYEFQVGLVECLIRLFPRKSRLTYASQFIRDTAMLEGFLGIKDREFETDCRKFLNDLNTEIDTDKNIYSIPCLAAFVGNKQLRKPSDTGYDQFWVDFNIGSQRMTLFCEQDSLMSQCKLIPWQNGCNGRFTSPSLSVKYSLMSSSMDEHLWETVAIYRSDILKCSCNEIQGTIILEVFLKQPVCELYPSQHQDVIDNTVRVEFGLERENELTEAVTKTFCFTGNRTSKVSTVVNPIHISVKEVQDIDSQSQPQESEDPELPNQMNLAHQASQESSTRRRKVSVPSVPMRTPLSTPSKSSEKIGIALGEITNTGFTREDNKLKAHLRKDASIHPKVSSTLNPLKVNTLENLVDQENNKISAPINQVVKLSKSEEDLVPRFREVTKKDIKENIQKAVKQKEVRAPKTPVSTAKVSKPKVKTPVVTINPPAVSKKKHKQKQPESNKMSSEIMKATEERLPKPSQPDLESISDSFPVDADVKSTSMSKETAGSKNTTMDSGINMDETSVSNVSTELKDQYEMPTAVKEDEMEESKHSGTEIVLNIDEEKPAENKQTKSETCIEKKYPRKLDKNSSRSQKKPRKNNSDINTDSTGKQAFPVTVSEESEDKFDFDSQQDKIPDSLEVPIEPNVKSKPDRSNITLSKNNSITNKYSKILSTKGSTKALRESIEETAKYIEEEANIRSMVNSRPFNTSGAKQSKSFVDEDPSLKEMFTLEHESFGKVEQCNKFSGKEEKKGRKLNGKRSESNRHEKALKSDKITKAKQEQSSFTRTLRKRDKNKSYKEIDESEISFVDNIQGKSGEKNIDEEHDSGGKTFKSKAKDIKGNARISEKKRSDLLLKKQKDKTRLPCTTPENNCHERSDAEESNKKICSVSYHTDEHVNETGSDVSSDVSEDYRFNDSQESQEIEACGSQQNLNGDDGRLDTSNKREDNENIEVWNKMREIPSKFLEHQVNQKRQEKHLNKETKEQKDSEKKASESVSVDKDAVEVFSSFESNKKMDDNETILNKNSKAKKQEKKENIISVVIAQKKDKMEFKDTDREGQLKQCQINSVSKKTGQGFVFQMSYCRSETNYKYNRCMSGSKKSTFSKGYDPYDFAACENETILSEESTNTDDKNREEHTFKPPKFFKCLRKHKDSVQVCSNETDKNSSKKGNSGFTQDSPSIDINLNDSLILSLNSPTESKSRSKQKREKRHGKTRLTRQSTEDSTEIETKLIDISSNSTVDDNKGIKTKCKRQKNVVDKWKTADEKNSLKIITDETVNSSVDSDNSLVSSGKPKAGIQKSEIRSEVNKQKRKAKSKNLKCDQIDSMMESDGSLVLSPNMYEVQIPKNRQSVKNTVDNGSSDSNEFSDSNNTKHKHLKVSKKHEKEDKQKSDRAEKEKLQDGTIELDSSDVSERSQDQSTTKRLLEQDPATKKWYRKSDLHKKITGKSASKREYRLRPDKKIQKEDIESPDTNEMDRVEGQTAESAAVESDAISDQEEAENCFSKIVKDMVASRSGKKTREKKLSINCNTTGKLSADDDFARNLPDSSFKEFDSEIVDCVIGDIVKTPCVSASLASTPKVGSARRKHYNPLNISVIKTPVSAAKSVTFDVDVGEADSDKENGPEERLHESKRRAPRRKKPVKYKDLSDEEIEKDERLSLCSSRRSVSSLLDSSNNVSTRSEKSWILERKKTPKPKPKTYKCKPKGKTLYSSQTESSEDDEEENKSIASRSLTGRTGTLSLDVFTPSLSNLYTEREEPEGDEETAILTPMTPLKLTNSQQKHEDDIEVYQTQETQENCIVSLNMDKKHEEVEDMDMTEMGSICLTALGVKTPQKYSKAEDVDKEKRSSHKKLKNKIKSFLGESGFVSGPSSEVRPSRSTLKRKYPPTFISSPKPKVPKDLVECESGSSHSSDEESGVEADKPALVPKKLFKLDHSCILETVKVESDTASTCSDIVEDQQNLELPTQSGLASFLSAFGADVKKHLNARKQKLEALTKTVLRSTQKYFSNTWIEQQQYQSNVTDDFQAKLMVELAQLEADIARMKEAEEKSEEFYRNQLHLLQENYHAQKFRLGNFIKLYSSYGDRARKIQHYNTVSHKSMMEQLRNEMSNLQKKLIEEIEKQELMNVRRGLQNLF